MTEYLVQVEVSLYRNERILDRNLLYVIYVDKDFIEVTISLDTNEFTR